MNKLFALVCAYYLAWNGAKVIESRDGYMLIGNGLEAGKDGSWDVEVGQTEGQVTAEGSGIFPNNYNNYDFCEFGGVWFSESEWASWLEYQAMAEAEAKAEAEAMKGLTPEEFESQKWMDKRAIRQNYLP